MGATNNQIGGRATIQQCQGYNLIIYDNGNGSPYRPLVPDGLDGDGQKIDQAAWVRNWLTRTPLSEAGFATLWILGSNTVQEKPTNPLITADMGVSFIAKDQGMGVSPDVDGLASFTFDGGTSATLVDFSHQGRGDFAGIFRLF